MRNIVDKKLICNYPMLLQGLVSSGILNSSTNGCTNGVDGSAASNPMLIPAANGGPQTANGSVAPLGTSPVLQNGHDLVRQPFPVLENLAVSEFVAVRSFMRIVSS